MVARQVGLLRRRGLRPGFGNRGHPQSQFGSGRSRRAGSDAVRHEVRVRDRACQPQAVQEGLSERIAQRFPERHGDDGLGSGRVRSYCRVLGKERGRQADGLRRGFAAGQCREPLRGRDQGDGGRRRAGGSGRGDRRRGRDRLPRAGSEGQAQGSALRGQVEARHRFRTLRAVAEVAGQVYPARSGRGRRGCGGRQDIPSRPYSPRQALADRLQLRPQRDDGAPRDECESAVADRAQADSRRVQEHVGGREQEELSVPAV